MWLHDSASPPIHCLFIVNWEMSNQLAPPWAHRVLCCYLSDWLRAPCSGLKGDTTKSPTLHLKGMQIQTKAKPGRSTMAALEQMALCCLPELKINPEVRTRRCSKATAALQGWQPLGPCKRLHSLNTPPPALPFKSKVASSSRRALSLEFQASGLMEETLAQRGFGLLMDTDGIWWV